MSSIFKSITVESKSPCRQLALALAGKRKKLFNALLSVKKCARKRDNKNEHFSVWRKFWLCRLQKVETSMGKVQASNFPFFVKYNSESLIAFLKFINRLECLPTGKKTENLHKERGICTPPNADIFKTPGKKGSKF